MIFGYAVTGQSKALKEQTGDNPAKAGAAS